MREAAHASSDGSYRIADGGLATGATLGGPRLAVRLNANGSIERVHSIDAGTDLIKGFDVHHYDGDTGLHLPRNASNFTLRPECQVQEYDLPGDLHVEKTTFALYDKDAAATCYVRLRVSNSGDRATSLNSAAVARVKRSFDDRIEVRWDQAVRTLAIRNRDTKGQARGIVCSETPASWMVANDHARIVANQWCGPFDRTIDAGGSDPLAAFHMEHQIGAGAARTFWFAVDKLSDGEAENGMGIELESADDALVRTRAAYGTKLKATAMVSPVGEIDLGVYWSKANMLRVMRETPTGQGFTNDPANSASCVGRDAAWFVHGCDWLDPDFSAALLRGFAARQEAGGKIVEFYDLRTGETNDDGLNVNDNTPLFILAVWHHAVATGDRDFLDELYPAARRAAKQLLAHRDERGLIFCTADGTGARGIVGWRNIIDDYRISGATTELNSEAFAALTKMAVLAKMAGNANDAVNFEREAAALRDAIELHLRNPENGLYYLTLDVDGRKRSEVTSDLVFPVIFGVADTATSVRIVQRLREADFWTEAGVRTVPRDAPQYEPARVHGLLGGVWVAVTFWYALAASRFAPDIMLEALQKTFAHYARDPRATNTVPGEFSEWLHGETMVNEGMMLSPWTPPRYLWAAIEGTCGLEPTVEGARIEPRLPPSWSWLGARNVPLRGETLAWFVARTDCHRLFTTHTVESTLPLEVYDRDVTEEVIVEGDDVATMAFARGGEVLVFIGNRSPHTVSVALRNEGILSNLAPRRRFECLKGEWKDDLTDERAEYIATIARGLFALIEFS
ncbi:MAG TPA: hypothetical protein VGF86_14305 [Candidatus Tumulicola sp.]|jgi:hypothetical protein